MKKEIVYRNEQQEIESLSPVSLVRNSKQEQDLSIIDDQNDLKSMYITQIIEMTKLMQENAKTAI